uniref:Uncharacterized protein n=1 Tax=Arundo donax TaxID=35708 RepID=A0A0A8YNG3_ARUDO
MICRPRPGTKTQAQKKIVDCQLLACCEL